MRYASVITLGGLLLFGLLARAADAQVMRLPAVELEPSSRAPAGLPTYAESRAHLDPPPYYPDEHARRDAPYALASYPDASDEPYQEPGEPDAPAWLLPPAGQTSPAGSIMRDDSGRGDALILREPDGPKGPPPGTRAGVFQKLILKGAWMPALNDRGIGMSDIELSTVLALPMPTRESPLLIVPGFAVYYFDEPTGGRHPDLPPRVYDAYVQFRWLRPVTDRLAFDLSFTPGYFSDFEKGSEDAIRYSGHAFAAWDWTPRLKLIVGVVYIDREDVGLLPGAGLIWKPHDDAVFELIFPRPRIARRIRFFGWEPEGVEHWLYVAGEYGGDLWSVQRADGSSDKLNYRDFRVLLGLERKVLGGLDSHLEVAYIFGRKFEYDNGGAAEVFEPSDTLMLRGGVTY